MRSIWAKPCTFFTFCFCSTSQIPTNLFIPSFKVMCFVYAVIAFNQFIPKAITLRLLLTRRHCYGIWNCRRISTTARNNWFKTSINWHLSSCRKTFIVKGQQFTFRIFGCLFFFFYSHLFWPDHTGSENFPQTRGSNPRHCSCKWLQLEFVVPVSERFINTVINTVTAGGQRGKATFYNSA